jgi:hypothetical protein
MKVQLPEALKADVPQSPWGKLLSATPVVMAVVATLLAGLASSEMTRAQYERALAAQQQSKAGDQWSFFQAKKLRGALQRNALDVVESTTDLHPLDPVSLRRIAEQLPADAARLRTDVLALLESPSGQPSLAALQLAQVPDPGAGLALPAKLKTALEAIENSRPDAELKALIAQVEGKVLSDALRAAQSQAQTFDATVKPPTQAMALLEELFARSAPTGNTSARRDFIAARLRFNALRYEAEARLNQVIANLHEVQVRQSNLAAERHHARSQKFFFGMLAAQCAVIVSTLALAAKQRSLLWSVAAAAGLAAIAFAIYVYLWV